MVACPRCGASADNAHDCPVPRAARVARARAVGAVGARAVVPCAACGRPAATLVRHPGGALRCLRCVGAARRPAPGWMLASALALGTPSRAWGCGACGTEGHNRRTCPTREQPRG